MQRFAALYAELDASTSTLDKVAALRRYLAQAEPADAAWAVYLLAGGRIGRRITRGLLRDTAMQAADLAPWLFEACHQAVGDLAETIAHVLPPARQPQDHPLAFWAEQRLLALSATQSDAEVAARLRGWWDELDADGRFLLCKLIGGALRVGVSRLLVQRALAEHAGLPPALLAERMMGYTDRRQPPSASRYQALLQPPEGSAARRDGQPYPFFLAQPLDPAAPSWAERLGPTADWQVEWKYDGIRAQVVRRAGQLWIWSRGEELITAAFPEVAAALQALPDGTVLDGELLVWQAGRPAPFAQLQRRLGRQQVPKKLLAEAPAVFIAYDLIEHQGSDQRNQALQQRRAALHAVAEAATHPGWWVAPTLTAADWPGLAAQREQAREHGVEGLMLKHRLGPYGLGRSGGAQGWWKWKVDALRVDAVLIYAQAGHGRRAGLYTDYTFAVWNRTPADAAEAHGVVEAIARREPPAADGLQLVTLAKAYSGLSDADMQAVDRVVRATTLESFGPVRALRPTLVFELGFEGLARSARHKSGLALRFPRMLRRRPDKPLHEADTLQTVQALLDGTAIGP